MKIAARKKAIYLRHAGWSYNVIAGRLGVSKSTLSNWLKDTPYTPNDETRRKIKAGPAKSAEIRHAAKVAAIAEAYDSSAREIGMLSKRDLMLLGIGLYIGEGTKMYEMVRVINANPDVIKLAVRWFGEICHVPISNLIMRIHIYPDCDEKTTLRYWSKISGIPLTQFQKTQIDRRTGKKTKKRGTLPYGTAHLSVRSMGNKRHGVMLHRKIIGWIEAIYSKMRA